MHELCGTTLALLAIRCQLVGGRLSIRRTQHHISEDVRLQSSRIVLHLQLAVVADRPFSVCVVSEALSDSTRFGRGVALSFTQCAEQLTADALS